MCVGIQQHLMSPAMNRRIPAYHLKKLLRLYHPPVICRIKMYLPHMECFIAAVNIARCPVVKPHPGFLSVQIRDSPILFRFLSVADKSPRLPGKQGICQTEAPVLRHHPEITEYKLRYLHGLYPLCHPLKNTGLQDYIWVCLMYPFCQFL